MISKYRAKPIIIDNIRFASTKEGKRYRELKLLFSAGQIRELELQPEFVLHADGIKIGKYRADFSYFEGNRKVIEDVKGVKTPLYRWKKRHVEAEYKVQIRET